MSEQLIQHENVQLGYRKFGSGVPLVLIHGFPFDHTMWHAQIVHLQETCQVIAPDLRGFGRSTLTEEDIREGVPMRRYASDIVAVLDEIGVSEPAILCGFSMGGYILWQLALEFPDRVQAMILCDTRAAADSEEARQGRYQLAEKVLQSGSESAAEALLPKLLAPETSETDESLVEQVAQMIRKESPQAIAAALRGMAQRPDVRDQLSQLDKPALVLGGSEDAISPPAEMQEIADALPSAEFVEIPHAAHMTAMENPAAVNEAIAGFVAGLK